MPLSQMVREFQVPEHTPGPWAADGGGHGPSPARANPDMLEWSSGVSCDAPFTENEAGDFERCDTQTVARGMGRTLAEAEANARLIAAAPDLLEALKHAQEALFWYQGDDFEMNGVKAGALIKAAIAKVQP